MSIYLPSVSDAMAERSMCHPGLPLPQGLGQLGSPGWDAFQSAKSARDRFSATFFVKAPSPSAESGWLLRFHGSSLVYVFPRSFKRLDIKIYRAIREVCSISELFLNNPTHKLDNLRAILCLTRINSSGSSTLKSRTSCINRSSYFLVRSVNIE